MGKAAKKIGNSVSKLTKKTGDNLESVGQKYSNTALAYMASPLIAQDITGARAASGGSNALTAPGEAVANPGGYAGDPRNQAELLQFNAALIAGAATGGAIGPAAAAGSSPFYAGAVAAPAVAGGAAAGATTQALGNSVGTGQIDAARQAAADEQAAAAQAEADSQAAAAQATAGAAKDPNVAEIARQRAARNGRRGTILTANQSLGGSSGSKSLLGL